MTLASPNMFKGSKKVTSIASTLSVTYFMQGSCKTSVKYRTSSIPTLLTHTLK